jgi:hypothetical protein
MDQLRTEEKVRDVLVYIHGQWVDVTEFRHEHPGGERLLSAFHMADATEVFERCMHSTRARTLLAGLTLDASDPRCPAEGIEPLQRSLLPAKEAQTRDEGLGLLAPVEHQCSSLFEYGLLVLRTGDSFLKAQLTLEAFGRFLGERDGMELRTGDLVGEWTSVEAWRACAENEVPGVSVCEWVCVCEYVCVSRFFSFCPRRTSCKGQGPAHRGRARYRVYKRKG